MISAKCDESERFINISFLMQRFTGSAVFRGGAGGARAPPEFGGSQKGRNLISAYVSEFSSITTKPPGFKKLYTVLNS